LKEDHKIFSGDYSRDFWDKINNIQYDEVQEALYLMGCRLQELEHKIDTVLTPAALDSEGRGNKENDLLDENPDEN